MKHLGTKKLQTSRLILRPFRLEDEGSVFRNWASDEEVTKFLTWPTHKSVEITHMVLESWEKENENPENYQWAIELKELGEPIGSISVVKTDDRTKSADIGFCIGKSWWGQGITAEALKAVMAFLFDEVGMNCIRACHDVHNPNSGRVMKKCGMTLEGIRRAAGVNNQGVCDEVWYAILKKEYETMQDGKSTVRQLTEQSQKEKISRMILEALPDWFGIPEAREEYIQESKEQLFFAVYDEEKPIGFLCLKETGKATMELAVMGVRKEYHRRGIGRDLFLAAKKCAVDRGYSFLQVKTVQMGYYKEYDDTNRFYLSMGFQELEVFPTLWGKENPCQIYVMKLA